MVRFCLCPQVKKNKTAFYPDVVFPSGLCEKQDIQTKLKNHRKFIIPFFFSRDQEEIYTAGSARSCLPTTTIDVSSSDGFPKVYVICFP